MIIIVRRVVATYVSASPRKLQRGGTFTAQFGDTLNALVSNALAEQHELGLLSFFGSKVLYRLDRFCADLTLEINLDKAILAKLLKGDTVLAAIGSLDDAW